MPDAKDNAKATGDTHPPELDRTKGSAQDTDEATPGRGINQAGFIKDRDAPTSDSYGNTRDAGETGQS